MWEGEKCTFSVLPQSFLLSVIIYVVHKDIGQLDIQ